MDDACRYCGERKSNALRHVCNACFAQWQIMVRKAGQIVTRAKRRGELPVLRGVRCFYCKYQSARVWEHRDYSRPLEVRPACPSCNILIGPADTPSAEFLAFVAVRKVQLSAMRAFVGECMGRIASASRIAISGGARCDLRRY